MGRNERRSSDTLEAGRRGEARSARSAHARALLIAIAALAVEHPDEAAAAPPQVLHTRYDPAPVVGGPGDLLFIAGAGLGPRDRVVYQALDAPRNGGRHPEAIPPASTATAGTAPIVEVSDPPYGITVQLPETVERERVYRLWVVNSAGEWSAPLLLNDPRPLWVTPAYAYATTDIAGLGRTIRVVGRNLEPAAQKPLWVRFEGPETYVVTARTGENPEEGARERPYVSEVSLPRPMMPGRYAVAVSRDRRRWITVPSQTLSVRPDPAQLPVFSIADRRFGACRADDGADDTRCFALAFAAAREAGGGTVDVPDGTWNVSTDQLRADQRLSGFVMDRNVHLRGAGPHSSVIVRRASASGAQPSPLLTLMGDNSVRDVAFADEERYQSIAQSRAVIRLGLPPSETPASARATREVDDIVISGDTFLRVGRGIIDSGLPIRDLIVARNVFGGYDNGLLLTGGGAAPDRPFRIDDSVIRANRFVPGSYLDVAERQGTVATQLGASRRMDFSDNVADGTSTEGLQDPQDPKGWRAAFFWNLTNSQEQLLVAGNRISCPGDKAGDGEAASFDENQDTFAFDTDQRVEAAAPSGVSVRGTLLRSQLGQAVPATYYDGHWVSVVAGPGMGQTRRIERYAVDPATRLVTFRVSPRWDVAPAPGRTRIVVLRQFWQVEVVGNDVTQAAPPCRKSNLNGPRGGVIVFWAPTADSLIAGNRQRDTDGIEFLQAYSARTASCPTCVGTAALATALEIRDNLIQGEYDWSSDCSWSGIRGYFTATPTPEAPPPVLGFGTLIAHNTISHADGQRGGAIDIARAGATGPPPGRWPMVQNLLIFGNVIRDVHGAPPRPACRQGQSERTGIRIEGPANVSDAVLQGNTCLRVGVPLEDAGARTRRLCVRDQENSCECAQR